MTITPAGHRRLVVVRQRKNEWLRDHLAALDGDDTRRLLDAVDVMERLTAQGPGDGTSTVPSAGDPVIAGAVRS